VLRHQLKSKIHRARITDSNVDYEGSISIPTDLMEAVDLWVLVTSITSGARLETYVIPGKPKSRHIVVNGAAAHLIGTGQVVTIMGFALHSEQVTPKRILLNERNEIVSDQVL
jgi:aspartate 1-decarboxylase